MHAMIDFLTGLIEVTLMAGEPVTRRARFSIYADPGVTGRGSAMLFTEDGPDIYISSEDFAAEAAWWHPASESPYYDAVSAGTLAQLVAG